MKVRVWFCILRVEFVVNRVWIMVIMLALWVIRLGVFFRVILLMVMMGLVVWKWYSVCVCGLIFVSG